MSGWPDAHAIVNGELYMEDPSSQINMKIDSNKHMMKGISMAQAAEAGSEDTVHTISGIRIPM